LKHAAESLIYSLWGDSQCVFVFGEIREDRDIKQEEVAKFLNLTQVAYSRYETGSRNIPNAILAKLSEYYGTSVDYLLRANR